VQNVESKRQVLSKPKARSRMSNGSVLPRGVDQRTLWARRLRDLLALHLGGDMANTASEAEKQILRRAVVITISLEQMEEKFALRGHALPNELELYQRLSNSARRLFEAVGLQRRSRDVTPPTLTEYLARRRTEASEAAE
jgi:hypothetical protein